MVTSTKRPGLEVAIHVESRPLQEYDDGDENIPPNTVTKYIKAKSGAEFAVINTFKPPFSPLHGVMINPIVNDMEEVNGLGPNPTDVKHALSSKGHIILLLHFVKDIREIRSNEYWERNFKLTPLDEIPKKALKGNALSHQIAYMQGLNSPERSQSRSGQKLRASLEALGIVPRDEPMTVPLEDRPEEELTPDELRELVRRMRQATATESRTHKRLQADPQVITID
ncbi:hypothetical protein COCC4DRAFT_63230 [Bipolaris maydis ATCC 48331]|uniref:DUF7918 domain-containing protein n=2 Tax=Cochliobolus heterostrophus TaxID=5016 RepID=M2VDE1_COCH5|nr:uncharacterized protein COCC4DRAFT_63230 [Bipolaris maydis ATCC 48331]EMD97723.1 hypothetical protein COCHEDRAFT_1026083 [Bipolaris maydis C5]ENI02881.1 hypothetical protein COCC4DRAFT_63230 [Bipolaris maydis ATCC 48331]KAJ6210930.1 hypothetical protein PSV09DRAFT_1026083 [Bipolaris maydis]